MKFHRYFFLIFLLCSCHSSNSQGKVYIGSSDYKYRSVISKIPLEINNSIVQNRESKILLVACPGATASMIGPLQQLLSLNSNITIQLVRDDCA